MVRKDGNSIILKGNGPLVWKEVLQSHFFYQNVLDFQLLSLPLHCFHLY